MIFKLNCVYECNVVMMSLNLALKNNPYCLISVFLMINYLQFQIEDIFKKMLVKKKS